MVASQEICQAIAECVQSDESNIINAWESRTIIAAIALGISLIWNLINSVIISMRRSKDLNWDAFKEEIYEPLMASIQRFDDKANPTVSASQYGSMEKDAQHEYLGEVFAIAAEIQNICGRADKHESSKCTDFFFKAEELTGKIEAAVGRLHNEYRSDSDYSILQEAIVGFSEGIRTRFHEERSTILKLKKFRITSIF